MTEFRVGDRVQVIGPDTMFYHEFDVGVVASILFDGLVVDVDFGPNHFKQHRGVATWAVPHFYLALVPEAADDILDGGE